MPTIIPENQIQNLQQIEAAVAGPEGANRLIIITGHLLLFINAATQAAGGQQQRNEAFSVLIGPVLTKQQFFRAIGTASLSRTFVNLNSVGSSGWGISGIDADRDDESGQVELRFDLFVTVSGQNNTVTINEVDFHVTILAAVAT